MIDFLVCLTFIIFAWRGYQKGLWSMVSTLASLVLGIFLGLRLYGVFQEFLGWNTNSIGMRFLAFACVFILTYFLSGLAAGLVKQFLMRTPLGTLDSALGAVLSVLFWAILLSFVFWLTDGLFGLSKDSYSDQLSVWGMHLARILGGVHV